MLVLRGETSFLLSSKESSDTLLFQPGVRFYDSELFLFAFFLLPVMHLRWYLCSSCIGMNAFFWRPIWGVNSLDTRVFYWRVQIALKCSIKTTTETDCRMNKCIWRIPEATSVDLQFRSLNGTSEYQKQSFLKSFLFIYLFFIWVELNWVSCAVRD